MTEMMMSRRGMFGGALAAGTLLALPMPSFAATGEKRLAFRNVHNNERIDARYFGANGFDRQGLAEINRGLRDWRTGEVAQMDKELLDLLVAVRDRLGMAPNRQFDLISGYRSSRTNNALRARGGSHTGVATKSQHMLGKATDIAMPGVSTGRVKLAAMSLRRGGVGWYPRDGFVHVDTGRVRSW